MSKKKAYHHSRFLEDVGLPPGGQSEVGERFGDGEIWLILRGKEDGGARGYGGAELWRGNGEKFCDLGWGRTSSGGHGWRRKTR